MKYVTFAITFGLLAMLCGTLANASYDAPYTGTTLVERMAGKKPVYSHAKYLKAYEKCMDTSGIYNNDLRTDECYKYANKVARIAD